MQIEIRDITPEEAAPYGGIASAVLAGRKTVVFTDADGNSGKLYMKEEEIDVLGERYIAENSIMMPSMPSGTPSGRCRMTSTVWPEIAEWWMPSTPSMTFGGVLAP